MHTGTSCDPRQGRVHESVYAEGGNVVTNVNEELVPALRFVCLDRKSVKHL